MDNPPVFRIETTRGSRGWLIELFVEGVPPDRVDEEWAWCGARIWVKDKEASNG